MSQCENCDAWCGDDYTFCRDCSDEPVEISHDGIVRETNAAVLIKVGEPLALDVKTYWLPISLCEIDDNVAWVPRWLAEEKGLINVTT